MLCVHVFLWQGLVKYYYSSSIVKEVNFQSRKKAFERCQAIRIYILLPTFHDCRIRGIAVLYSTIVRPCDSTKWENTFKKKITQPHNYCIDSTYHTSVNVDVFIFLTFSFALFCLNQKYVVTFQTFGIKCFVFILHCHLCNRSLMPIVFWYRKEEDDFYLNLFFWIGYGNVISL